MKKEKHFGIDLGTNNCIVTYLDDANNKINTVYHKGKGSIKSIVTLQDICNITIGELDEKNLEKSFTRTKGKLGNEKSIVIGNKQYSIQYCAALMLNYIKKMNNEMKDVVITIPTFYNQSMRNATIEAAMQAGFDNIKLIEEPTAAAMYHIYKRYIDNPESYLIKDKKILIFDMGGGTTDISLVEIKVDKRMNVEPKVLKIKGLDNFGGYLIDLLLAKLLMKVAIEDASERDLLRQTLEKALIKLNYYIDSYKDKNNDELFKEEYETNLVLFKFLEIGEEVKIMLSKHEFYTANIEGYLKDLDISREDFEEAILEEENIISNIEALIKEFKIENPVCIDEVVLVGGSTKIPLVKSTIGKLFSESICMDDEDYINAVSKGASIVNSLNSGHLVEPFAGNLCTGVIPRDIFLLFNGEKKEIFEAGTAYPIKEWKRDVIKIPFSLCESLNIKIFEADSDKVYLISDTEFFHPCFFTGDEIIIESNIDENGMLIFRASHNDTKEIIEFNSKKEFGLDINKINNGKRHIENNVIFIGE